MQIPYEVTSFRIHHLPSLPVITFQHRSFPPLAISICSGTVKVAVLSARDDVHPGGRFGEFPPLWGERRGLN